MKITTVKSYGSQETVITTANGDVVTVYVCRKFGSPGWCLPDISTNDNNLCQLRYGSHTSRAKDIDSVEQFARALLKAVRIARKLQDELAE